MQVFKLPTRYLLQGFTLNDWRVVLTPEDVLNTLFKRKYLSFSVTRMGEILKFMLTDFLTKVAQMYVELLGCFENIHFHV